MDKDLAEALSESYPPLARYCPHLPTISLPQARFLLDDSREVGYGGAAGGGKSDALLMAALQYMDVPGYRALILRRTFVQLRGPDGLIPRAQQWLAGSDAVQKDDGKKWVFPSGAELHFGHVDSEQDKFNYDGLAAQFIGFDELTHFSETQYEWIAFSRARRTLDVPVPIRARSSMTPTGLGYGWVRRRFITHRADDIGMVPALPTDNPGLDVPDYVASLSRLPEATRKRLLEGDWEAFEGAAFPDFDEKTHAVEPFPVPNEWDRFECMDFGVTNPTAWLMVATDYDGNLIVAGELYGPDRDGNGKPVGALASTTAPLVLALRKQGWEQHDTDGWKTHTNRVWADPSIRNTVGIADRMGNKTSVMQEFADLGVGGLVPANNDRQAGFLRLAELIRLDENRRFPAWHPRAGEHGAPRLFVQRHCENVLEQLRVAPLEPEGKPLYGEAIAGEWESGQGHAVAALRYGCLSRPGASAEPPPPPATTPDELRREAVREHLAADDDEDTSPWRLT